MYFAGRCGVRLLTVTFPSFAEFMYYIGIVVMSAFYYAIDVLYRLFMAIGSARIFEESTIESFAQRIYIVLGIVMLFFVTYQLFQMLIEPNKLTGSGKDSGKQVFLNIITTIVMLTLTSFAFNFAYRMQDAILSENVLGKMFFGVSGSSEYSDVRENGGKDVAATVFSAFYYPKGDGNEFAADYGNVTFTIEGERPQTYKSLMDRVAKEGPYFLRDLSCNDLENRISFRWFFGFLSCIYVAWVLVSFCIDMGLRVVKLGFYQIIAPIPIAFRILPNKANVFREWLSEVISTFVDIFIRIAVMYFGIYIVKAITSLGIGSLWSSAQSKPSILIQIMAQILIILGVFKFMADAPGLVSKLFGFKGNGMSFGIVSKIRGNKYGMGAIGATGGLLVGTATNLFKKKGGANRFRSALGGGASGMYNGARNAMNPNARLFSSLRDTQRQVVENRERRDERRNENRERRRNDERTVTERVRDTTNTMLLRNGVNDIVDVTHRIEAGDTLNELVSNLQNLYVQNPAYNELSKNIERTRAEMNAMNQDRLSAQQTLTNPKYSTQLDAMKQAYGEYSSSQERVATAQRTRDERKEDVNRARQAVAEKENRKFELQSRKMTLERQYDEKIATLTDAATRQSLETEKTATLGRVQAQIDGIDTELVSDNAKLNTAVTASVKAEADYSSIASSEATIQTQAQAKISNFKYRDDSGNVVSYTASTMKQEIDNRDQVVERNKEVVEEYESKKATIEKYEQQREQVASSIKGKNSEYISATMDKIRTQANILNDEKNNLGQQIAKDFHVTDASGNVQFDADGNVIGKTINELTFEDIVRDGSKFNSAVSSAREDAEKLKKEMDKRKQSRDGSDK